MDDGGGPSETDARNEEGQKSKGGKGTHDAGRAGLFVSDFRADTPEQNHVLRYSFGREP